MIADRPHLPGVLTDDAVTWAENNWQWEHVTDGETRCLWVLEQFLAESNHRLYHLPRGLKPRRIGGGIQVVVAEECAGTWDFPGLSALVVAAHVATVRAALSVETVHTVYDESEWETVAWSWDPLAVEPDNSSTWKPNTLVGSEKAVMVLSLHPRQAEGGIMDRHPGVERLTDLIDLLGRP